MSYLDVLKMQKYYGCTASSEDVVRRFTNAATGLTLTAFYSSVFTQSRNNGSSELWIVRPVNGDSYNLINVFTGYYLDSDSSGYIYAYPRNWDRNQRWTFNGSTIVNYGTGLALDSNPAQSVYGLSPNSGNYQNWNQET